MKKTISIALCGLLCCLFLDAQALKFGELFNEGAVIQRNAKVLVWGTALPSAKVTVAMQGKIAKVTSNSKGDWSATLPMMKEGGPYPLVAYCKSDTLKINQVFVGEVWIAGGQSNMAFMLQNSIDGKAEITQATNPNIRFVMVPYKAYEGDKTRGDMKWRTATTDNVASMSAVGYYFAKDLQAKLNVPIGVICCYKGGSGAETWMNRESILKNEVTAPIVEKYEANYAKMGAEKYLELVAKFNKDLKQYNDTTKEGKASLKKPSEPMGEQNYNRPYGLYHTMLKRVIPYTVQGAIWYQGEHNSSRAAQYRTLFPAMIDQWRSDFQNPDMPFLFVQLSNYDVPTSIGKPIWAELREAQLMTWQKVKLTGMAVSIDVGDQNNIHPTQKEPVGKRLAASALYTVYGINCPYSGPVYKCMKIESNQAILTFDFTYDGLIADEDLKGFTICGADHVFVPAKAVIRNGQIVVSSESVSMPVAVRYGWSNWTDANLKNKAGFPATPFRTDDFPMITGNQK